MTVTDGDATPALSKEDASVRLFVRRLLETSLEHLDTLSVSIVQDKLRASHSKAPYRYLNDEDTSLSQLIDSELSRLAAQIVEVSVGEAVRRAVRDVERSGHPVIKQRRRSAPHVTPRTVASRPRGPRGNRARSVESSTTGTPLLALPSSDTPDVIDTSHRISLHSNSSGNDELAGCKEAEVTRPTLLSLESAPLDTNGIPEKSSTGHEMVHQSPVPPSKSSELETPVSLGVSPSVSRKRTRRTSEGLESQSPRADDSRRRRTDELFAMYPSEELVQFSGGQTDLTPREYADVILEYCRCNELVYIAGKRAYKTDKALKDVCQQRSTLPSNVRQLIDILEETRALNRFEE